MGQIDPSWTTCMIDISHYRKQVADWNVVRASGIVAVIHKSTEGATWADDYYKRRRDEIRGAGLLWGAFHFAGIESTGKAQAEHFLKVASPEENDFIAFDCEKQGAFQQMEDFCVEIHRQLSRWPVIYGRHRLRSSMKGHGDSPLTNGHLWFDEYPPPSYSTPYSEMPEGWDDWTLWQYTEGDYGPHPRHTAGIGTVDRSAFKGTTAEFRAAWPFTGRR